MQMPIPASRALVPYRPYLIVQTDREERRPPVIGQVASREQCHSTLRARKRLLSSTRRFFDYDVRVYENGRLRFAMTPFSQSGPWAPIEELFAGGYDDDDI